MEIILNIIIGAILGFAVGFLAAKYTSAKLTANNQLLNESLINTKAELEAERKQVLALNTESASLKADKINLEQKLKSYSDEFENVANNILKNVTKELTDTNKDRLNDILTPLKDKISDFEKKVDEVYNKEAGERNVLKGEINKIIELNKKVSEGAENLTSALKGDKKKQGDWGEERLEILLQKAGLKKDIHYKAQETFTNEEGKNQRLDIILYLPDNKSLIIDSKVSLNDYTSYYNCETDEQRDIFLKKHIQCIYSHINNLSGRNYHQLYDVNTPEFILMYIPIEAAFYLAVENDKELFLWALEKKNIVLVTTTTLLATLSTVSFIWSQENQKRNVLEIARQSGALYDKFASFVDDLRDIGDKLNSTKESYLIAMKKLCEGSGNLIKRAEEIRQLGAKTTKSIDQRIVDKAAGSDDDELRLIKSS